jgi:signal transduction histidine kinase
MMESAKRAARRSLETVRDDTRSLVTGALVFRWVWLIWMAGLTAMGQDEMQRVGLAWASIGIAAGWTLWLTFARSSLGIAVLILDLALCSWLIVASALVVDEGGVISGRPFFATGYPLSAPLLWAALKGPWAGVATAAILSVAHVASRPLNGVPLASLSPSQVQNLTGAILNYFVGGVAVGLVARLLQRSSEAVRRANQATVEERELSARLSERESLARAIHDSVLQVLALVHKKGRDLASRSTIDPSSVKELADIAGAQEIELRSMILREPEAAPLGRASLREALEVVSRGFDGLRVEMSATGALWIEAHVAQELAGALRQALENVDQHSKANRANVFAEEENGAVCVTVRDDGVGFIYDEKQLQAAGKVGMLKSMKGRVADLGGTMRVTSAPGKGTEIEFRVPVTGD